MAFSGHLGLGRVSMATSLLLASLALLMMGRAATAVPDDSVDDLLEQYGLTCPILQEPLTSPIVAIDGHSYSLKGLALWCRNFEWGACRSPISRTKLTTRYVHRNEALACLVRNFQDELNLYRSGDSKSSLSAWLAASQGGKQKLFVCSDGVTYFEERSDCYENITLRSLLLHVQSVAGAAPYPATNAKFYWNCRCAPPETWSARLFAVVLHSLCSVQFSSSNSSKY
ncbi:unnamed protein product (mitochondrion) [Plasmodiophora brassicae]|uniref:U-box domain-containing protein n=1 Tax=Plasmodiophora brassicae TaxID=37360 RepID=A0A3P3YL76_PLABS|nr:unnamed protein product [Plasmodiophora brassicae]